MPDEVMVAAPTHDALIQSQIQAMRSMTDQMAMQARQMERMAVDIQTARDGIIELRAQDLKATILAVRAEAMSEIEKVDIKTDANAKAISRIQGIFLPLGVLVTAILTYLAQWAANVTSGGGLPPHHP